MAVSGISGCLVGIWLLAGRNWTVGDGDGRYMALTSVVCGDNEIVAAVVGVVVVVEAEAEVEVVVVVVVMMIMFMVMVEV